MHQRTGEGNRRRFEMRPNRVVRGVVGVVAVVIGVVAWGGAKTAGSEPLFIDGERLEFEILYGFVPAGHATLEVTSRTTERGDVFRITSKARSNDVISLMFEVDDRIMAEVDRISLKPLYFEKRLREGPFSKDESVLYGDEVVTRGDRSYTIEPGTRDILSALYYVRGQDLEVGDEVRVRTFDGGKNYEAVVSVLRRERVDSELGEVDCLVVRPELREGPFAKTGDILIWLTDDDLKVPVLLKSRVAIGSFVARLIGSTHAGV
jgi:hypothetical protein